jgi:hypothetical protein
VPTAIGGLSTVTDLVVTDTFGERTVIRPSETAQPQPDEPPWSMFTLSGAGRRSALLMMAPTLGVVDDGPGLGTVSVLGDDLAAMAWAVEHSLHGTTDRAVDAYDAFLARVAADPPPVPTAPARMVRPPLRLHRPVHARLTGGNAEADAGWRRAVT